MTNPRTSDTQKAKEILENILDIIAFDLQMQDSVTLGIVQEKVSRAYYLLDREYGEDEHNDGRIYQGELDFGDGDEIDDHIEAPQY